MEERWWCRRRRDCCSYPARPGAIGERRSSVYMARVVSHVYAESQSLSAGRSLDIDDTAEGGEAMVVGRRKEK